MGLLDDTPIAARRVLLAIERRDIPVKRVVALLAPSGLPPSVGLVHGSALVAPVHVAVHDRVEKLKVSFGRVMIEATLRVPRRSLEIHARHS